MPDLAGSAQLAAADMTNSEIGEQLLIPRRTVGSHLYHLFPKLGVTARAQLADALCAAEPVAGQRSGRE
jgi:DNA-binding CsgD family transcriptional regulator